MGKPIIWYNTLDDTWGACNNDALLVVNADDLTEEEHKAYLDAHYDEDVCRLITRAWKRINKKAEV